MNLKRFIRVKKKGIYHCFILVVIFLVSVILPIIVYLNALDLDSATEMGSYLNRLESSLLSLSIIGILIILSKSLTYVIHPISLAKIGFSVLTSIFFILYIVISANAEVVELGISWFYLKIDYSVFSLLIIPVPILALIRNIIVFIYQYEYSLYKLVILNIVAENSIKSKNQIRKLILKRKDISPTTKRNILNKFQLIIGELETIDPPLLVLFHNKYRVSTAGQKFLKNNGFRSSKKEKSLNKLEVWTESELQKLAHKRSIKI